MEFGVHLPLLDFRGQAFSLSYLVDYTETAEQLGFSTLCANDHLIASRHGTLATFLSSENGKEKA